MAEKIEQQVLVIGGFHYGFRFYGPFPLDLDDPASIEEAHMNERDYHEGMHHWVRLEVPKNEKEIR